MSGSVHKLTLEMPLFSKARPRLSQHGAYMASSYRDKQRRMRLMLREQWKRDPLEGPLKLEIDCRGEGRGDVDNIAGALMDAANGILWLDDRCSIIPSLTITWAKCKRPESVWHITITELSDA
jgi:Holliday junction resolvase RusA-like endonuclease